MDAKAGVTLGIEMGINFIISGFLNGLCAWLWHHTAVTVPTAFWSLFIDTAITCYLVSVCTAFFATKSGKRYLVQGMYVTVKEVWNRRLQSLPETAFPIGCCLFGMYLPVLIAVFWSVFHLAGTTAMSVVCYMIFKGVWGGLYGAFICIVVLLRHLGTVP